MTEMVERNEVHQLIAQAIHYEKRAARVEEHSVEIAEDFLDKAASLRLQAKRLNAALGEEG